MTKMMTILVNSQVLVLKNFVQSMKMNSSEGAVSLILELLGILPLCDQHQNL